MSHSQHVVLHESVSALDRTLRAGVGRGILDADVLSKIRKDASKGIVQIATFISTPYLHAELERAFSVFRGLVDIGLNTLALDDPARAAMLLRDTGILAMSREGNARIKALRVLQKKAKGIDLGQTDAEFLENWAKKSWSAICMEEAACDRSVDQDEMARWIVAQVGGRMELDGTEAEMWAKTALLANAVGTGLPDGVAAMRTLLVKLQKVKKIPLPSWCLPKFRQRVASWCDECEREILPVLRKASSVDAFLVANTEHNPLAGWIGIPDASLHDVDLHATQASDEWLRRTGRKGDHATLLTLFVNVAMGRSPERKFPRSELRNLVRLIRDTGLDGELALAFIDEKAPPELHDDLKSIWSEFLKDLQTLHGIEELTQFLEGELKVPAKIERKGVRRSEI